MAVEHEAAPGEHDEARPATLPLSLRLTVGSYALEATLAVPAAPIKPQAVLPALQALSDAVVDAAMRELDATGRRVSCKPGCAACCRQAVSISAVEAYHIHDLVAAMPPARQDAIRQRFADASCRIKEAGLYDALIDPAELAADDRVGLGLRYLALGIPCPFLEDERCTIYADRPLRCREHLVSSPPEHCARPANSELEAVPVLNLSRALAHIGHDGRPAAWPLLSLALDWVALNPDDMKLRPGPDWVRDILGHAGSPEPNRQTARAADEPPPADNAGGIALPMPRGEVTAVDMLPTFRAYTNAAVEQAIAISTAQGKPPSCRAGCSACCRYPAVPISTIEARRIAALVDAMPEPRRAQVRARFGNADRRIEAWREAASRGIGLNHERQSEDDKLAAYFRLGITCPLLENDRCSIYDERPLVCREYLVTSPPENCTRLEDPGVHVEAVPRMRTPVALAHLLSDETPPRAAQVFLGQALRWVAENPEHTPPRRNAEVWLERFLHRLRHVDELMQRHDRTRPAGTAPDELRLAVPAAPVAAQDMLPAFRAVTDASVRQAAAAQKAAGERITCAAGCSACCRQLVPVGALEAHAIAALVNQLPEPRRSTVRARFAAAEARLAAWPYRADLDCIDQPRDLSGYQLGIAYFQLAIPCPFLEDNRCSVYEQRPLACREHLVTSPAAHCARESDAEARIDVVPGPQASQALACIEDDPAGLRRIPLVLALSWAAAHPSDGARLPGRVWVERFVARLRGLR